MTLVLESGVPHQRPEDPRLNLEPPFRQVIRLLRRQRRLVLTCAVVGAILGGVIGLLIPPRYTATAELATEPQLPVLSGGQLPAMVTPEDESTIQSYMVALSSYGHLEQVIASLAHDPPLPKAPRSSIQHLRFLDPGRRVLTAWLSQAWAMIGPALNLVSPRYPPPAVTGAEHSGQKVEAFKRHLHVFQEQGSHVIGVSFSSTDPQEAARAANRVAQLYADTLYSQKREATQRTLIWINERIPELKQQLDAAEAAAQEYRGEHGLAQGNETDTLDQQLADLNRRVIEAAVVLAQKQAQLDAIHQVELAQIRGIRGSSPSQVRRTEDDPQVKAAALQLQALREQLAAVQARSNKARAAEARFQDLERTAAIMRQVYESLLQRREALIEQQQMIAPDVRVLSLASPPDRPSSVNPMLFPLPTTVVFLIGAVLVAVVRDRMDQGLRSTRDVTEALNIPCIGLVPKVRRTRRMRPHQLLLAKPFALYTEAIRSLAASLQLTMPHALGRAVLVSSSVPREGKTTLAVSLATYAALIGRRVVLVDLDFRRPAVWREIRRNRRVPDRGDQDCLSMAAIEPVPQLGLDVLPLRRRPEEPLLPFAGGELPRLLSQLRGSYDLIVVDGPPMLAVTEARLLALLVDKVVFAVKWGSTRRDMAQNALGLLYDARPFDGRPGEMVAGVVTQVDVNKHAEFRYGDVGESLVRYARYYTKGLPALPPWNRSPTLPAKGDEPTKRAR